MGQFLSQCPIRTLEGEKRKGEECSNQEEKNHLYRFLRHLRLRRKTRGMLSVTMIISTYIVGDPGPGH